MLLPDNINPDKSIYYVGAKILEALKKEKSNTIDVLELYNRYKQYKNTSISFKYFLFGLDWLYLLGMIKHEKGNIEKCF